MKVGAICLALSALSLSMPAGVRADDALTDVPAALQGVWGKQGRCDVEADRLRITSHAAALAGEPLQSVKYSPADKAIYWTREYQVDNFQMSIHPGILIYNSQGFHMPGQIGYERCGAGLARLPWPPKPD